MRPLVCAMFFLSGCAALLFETLWFHQAGLALGNSVWASSLVLAGFMGGLAAGSGWIGRVGHRIARPVRLYAVLEIIIAVTGVALVHTLPTVTPLLSTFLRPILDEPWLVNPTRLGLSFFLLLLPSAAMGATLPLLVAALTRWQGHFGRALGLLYGWNTLGAVVGAVVGEAWLVGQLGIRTSALVAAGLNLTAAVAAMALAPRLDGRGVSAATPPAAPLPPRALGLLLAAFCAGAALLALEVVWFRFLLLFVYGTDLTFAVMLAVVLAGIGLGGLAGSAWLSRRPEAHRHSGSVLLAAGVLCILAYVSIGPVLDVFFERFGTRVAVGFGALRLAIPLMLPIAFVSGTVFTLLGQALERAAPAETRSAGMLALANTLGAMLGPLVAGFVLLPRFGIERSLHGLAALYGVAALCALAARERPAGPAGRRALAAVAASLLLGLVLFPQGRLQERYLNGPLERWTRGGDLQVVAFREALTGTIVYLKREVLGQTLHHLMTTDTFSMSGTALSSQRYMELFVYLPVAIRPEPRSALLISYGVGNTAKALTHTASLERIDVVDTSRAVLEMNDIVYPDPAEHPLNDPRVVVHVEDGRHFLQTTDRRFDLITGEPPPPKVAGVHNLYTKEYFALARDRLTEGGVLSYWLPVHALDAGDRDAIIAAFCGVFSDCTLWTGVKLDWILVGTRNAQGPVPEEAFTQQWRSPATARRLQAIGVETPTLLGTLFMADSEDLHRLTAAALPLVDDHPKRLSETSGEDRKARPHRLWLDPATARERFANSPFVRAHWPARLRSETLAAFDTRQWVLSHFFRDWEGTAEKLTALHDALGRPGLRTLPLWIAGGTWDEFRIAENARRRGADGVWIRRQLGALALAEGRFAEAADHYATIRRRHPRSAEYLTLELYALHRAGRHREATERAGKWLDPVARPEDASTLAFLRATFGRAGEDAAP